VNVPVVNVGKVRVPMGQNRMSMFVNVWLDAVPGKNMLMPVMLVVDIGMSVA
jgi:hypothetical protein